MLKFNPGYFVFTVVFLSIEVFIALYVRDNFIRPYLGDLLVVILIYCFLKAFFKIPVFKAVLLVLAFSFLIEFLQYVDLIGILGLEHSTPAKMILGNSFSWEDLLMYLVGGVTILLVENIRLGKRSKSDTAQNHGS